MLMSFECWKRIKYYQQYWMEHLIKSFVIKIIFEMNELHKIILFFIIQSVHKDYWHIKLCLFKSTFIAFSFWYIKTIWFNSHDFSFVLINHILVNHKKTSLLKAFPKLPCVISVFSNNLTMYSDVNHFWNFTSKLYVMLTTLSSEIFRDFNNVF